MKTLLLLVTCSGLWAAEPSTEVREQIREAMAAQEKSWNSGDLEGFMAPYWRSEKLTFIGQRGVTHGWQATLDNYKKSYPDKAAMGQLKFGVLSVEHVGSDHLYMIGTWQLSFPDKEDAKGHFTLIWKNFAGTWKIIADHSS